MTITLGTSAGKPFTMPADFVTETTAILGRRGSGKTNTAVVIAEEVLAAHHHVVIIDPEGVWWGLISSRDGVGVGLPLVIFGGEHQHLPLPTDAGKTIADAVVEHSLSCILDLSEKSVGDRQRFVTAFCERVHEAKQPAAKRTPMLVIIDEADRFCPQRVFAGQEQMLHAVSQLSLRSRVRGVGSISISQRPARLHKDVLTQAEVLIAHQINGPQDKDALREWVQEHDDGARGKAFMASINTLARGTGWVWSPVFLGCFCQVQVRQRTTFDSSATPKVGKKLATPTAWAAVDIGKMKVVLATAIEEAAAKDPAKLQARIRELERAATKAAPVITKADVEHDLRLAIETAERRWTEILTRIKGDLLYRIKSIIAPAEALATYIDANLVPPPAAAVAARSTPKALAPKPRINPEKTAPGYYSGADLTKGQRAVLTVLAQDNGREVSASKTALRACYSIRSSTWRNILSSLRSAEGGPLLTGSGGGPLAITAAGLERLGRFDPLPTGAALLDHWRRELGGGAPLEIFNAMVEAYPGALSKEAIEGLTGYAATSSTTRNALSKLNCLGLLSGRGDERKLSDELMESA